ncbi:hypothetical protein [Hymenobacter properus]|uniref:Glycosyltransferase RgtA/B/C/D-like domain-containing protein n=1 Tax=Hymenobacter properus TaxID=2791026 RepID=A0A931BP78_9BACT|nr:hypothetical protein [Hymenobacter properus]MBF9143080.1 hypothetical protein [Hymenobacter properus]MBR7721888.1 hypothetical protein [Microvirga sp. SRT04]
MKNWLRLALLTAFYGALFLVFTWPLAAHFTSEFLVVPGHDSYTYPWNVWHFRTAVQTGQPIFHTDWLFYPGGAWLLLHTYTPILGLIGLLVGNDLLAVNLGLLLSYALSGAGAYLLARRWLQSPLLSLLAGFIFAYSPYKLQRLPEHYNLVLTATVPFYVLAFLQAFAFEERKFLPRVRSWGAVAGCVALGFITLLSDYYVLFGLLYFSLAYAAWYWLALGRIRWGALRTWAWLGGILVVSHVLIRLLRRWGVDDHGAFWWGGDLVSFLLPPPTSRFVYWNWAARLYHNPQVFNMPGSLENTLFIGYALPLLAIGLWLLRRVHRRPLSAVAQDAQGRPLAWVLIFFAMLTVPALRIYGHDRLHLPTALLHFIPFFNNIRCPTRWIMMVGLFLPILTFSALEAAWPARLHATARTALGLVLVGLVLFEYWPRPYDRSSRAAVPRVFHEVARMPGKTLIPVPLGASSGNRLLGQMKATSLFYQTVHHKKMPIGYLSRVSDEQFAALQNDPVLGGVLRRQIKPDTVAPAPPGPGQVQAFLRQYDPAAFVISPEFREQPAHLFLRQLLQPYGYREQLVDGYVLLTPPGQ